MSIISIVGEAIGKVTGLIDSLHTSGEEKLAAKAALLTIQGEITGKILEHDAVVAKEQGQNIRAEATGGFLQRNWRPLTALVFVFIIANNYVIVPYVQAFGGAVPTLEIPGGMWALLTTMITGYTVSRGAEKVAATMTAMKGREET